MSILQSALLELGLGLLLVGIIYTIKFWIQCLLLFVVFLVYIQLRQQWRWWIQFYILRVTHQLIVLFLILAPFCPKTEVLWSFLIFVPILAIHWKIFKMRCLFTLAENNLEMKMYNHIVSGGVVDQWIPDGGKQIKILGVLIVVALLHLSII